LGNKLRLGEENARKALSSMEEDKRRNKNLDWGRRFAGTLSPKDVSFFSEKSVKRGAPPRGKIRGLFPSQGKYSVGLVQNLPTCKTKILKKKTGKGGGKGTTIPSGWVYSGAESNV